MPGGGDRRWWWWWSGGGRESSQAETDRRTRVIGQAVLLAGGRSLFAASEVIMGPRSGSL
jgi:hypothetical protein